MTYAHDRFPKKKAVNVSLSEDIIEGAKKHGINLSELIEKRIAREIRTMNMRSFCETHKDAISERADYDQQCGGTFTEHYGVLKAQLRNL